MNNQLRSAIIRLAYAKPELRPHLLPLVSKKAAAPLDEASAQKWVGEVNEHLQEVIRGIKADIKSKADALMKAQKYFEKYDKRNLEEDIKDVQDIVSKKPSRWSKGDRDFIARHVAWKMNENPRDFLGQLVSAVRILQKV